MKNTRKGILLKLLVLAVFLPFLLFAQGGEENPGAPGEGENPASVPSLCTEHTVAEAAFARAPVAVKTAGFAAEWFVAPAAFNMPLEVFRLPDGRIFVQSVRSNTLFQLGLDGKATVFARNVPCYLGTTTRDGEFFLFNFTSGEVYRVTGTGKVSLFAKSALLQTACGGSIVEGPDGDLYVNFVPCNQPTGLARVSRANGRVTVLGNLPALVVALCLAPDGRLLAAGGNTVFELSPAGLSLRELFRIPSNTGIDESGLAADTRGNIYVATGNRGAPGALFRKSFDGGVEKIADLAENGFTGIEWVEETGEIIGAQLGAGSVMAVNTVTKTVRTVVPGNGLISPMALAFSACGELAVSNDDGGYMSLINRAGTVQRWFNYISFTPPIPYVAIGADGVLYASMCATGLPNGVFRVDPPGNRQQSLYPDLSPSGIFLSQDGALVVAETNAGRITRINPDGSRVVLASGLAYPRSLALAADGVIYFTAGGKPINAALPSPFSGDSVWSLGPDGKTKRLSSAGGAAIAVSAQGEIFLAAGNKIARVMKNGAASDFATGFQSVIGLAFDLAGNLYASDQVANGIVRITGFPRGTITGRVLAGDGTPAANVRVTVYRALPSPAGLAVRTDSEGRFSVTVAAGGEYAVVIADPERYWDMTAARTRSAVIRVNGNETKSVELRMDADR